MLVRPDPHTIKRIVDLAPEGERIFSPELEASIIGGAQPATPERVAAELRFAAELDEILLEQGAAMFGWEPQEIRGDVQPDMSPTVAAAEHVGATSMAPVAVVLAPII